MSILSSMLEALFKCQSEIGWGGNGNEREQFSTDGTHLRSEFRIIIQILILTGSSLNFFSFFTHRRAKHRWVGQCVCICIVKRVCCGHSLQCCAGVNVIKDRNGLAMPLYSIIIDKVLIWPVGCFHLQVSFLPGRDVLTSPSLLVSEYKWALFYLSK